MVYFAGCTAHPDAAWVAQQARQMTWELHDRAVPMRYLIHDHDTKFTGLFDRVGIWGFERDVDDLNPF